MTYELKIDDQRDLADISWELFELLKMSKLRPFARPIKMATFSFFQKWSFWDNYMFAVKSNFKASFDCKY